MALGKGELGNQGIRKSGACETPDFLIPISLIPHYKFTQKRVFSVSE